MLWETVSGAHRHAMLGTGGKPWHLHAICLQLHRKLSAFLSMRNACAGHHLRQPSWGRLIATVCVWVTYVVGGVAGAASSARTHPTAAFGCGHHLLHKWHYWHPQGWFGNGISCI